ncbi:MULTISPECIES: radical SAM protein [unclassified Pseudomonas]
MILKEQRLKTLMPGSLGQRASSEMVGRLEIILKLTERCNIACTYCYYFENDDRSALTRPWRFLDESVPILKARIQDALLNGFCDSVRIIFHGGEPLLFGKVRFRALCLELMSIISANKKVALCMQTNAMLVDDEWIEIFQEFKIGVGVSVDGPREVHDRFRLDKRGRATFDKTVAGIHKLVGAAKAEKISPPGALIVIQPAVDPAVVYDFVVNDLGIKNMDFLLPDATCENPIIGTSRGCGEYLCLLLDHWLCYGQGSVDIRILTSTVSLLLGRHSLLGGFGPARSTALTVLSDGDINGDDFLRPCGDHVVDLGMNLSSNGLMEAFDSNEVKLSSLGADEVPLACGGCAYERICCGGQLTHRYSVKDGFRNKSIYCKDLKIFYEHVCGLLYRSGVNLAEIEYALR